MNIRTHLPTRLHAIYILARGGTVIYRADIHGGVTLKRKHWLVAESVFDGRPNGAAITVEMDPVPGLELAP